MGDTIILMMSFPLIIGGMILTIMWAMSAGANAQAGRAEHSSQA